MTDFLPLEKVAGDIEYYGVKVAVLGEDGDMGEVAFTHDVRRAIAAVCAYHRSTGYRVDSVSVDPPAWWRFVDNCGCGDTCPCPKDEDGDADHECEHFGLPPCRDEGFSWLGLVCKADDPGAIPVIQIEVDLR